MHGLALLVPVKIYIVIICILCYLVCYLFGNSPDLIMVIAGNPQHNRIMSRRPRLDGLKCYPYLWKLIFHFLINCLSHFQPAIDILSDNYEL